jgi:hypothetical protein
MVITRQVLAKQLSEYLQHNVTIEELVDWAERAMMEADFEPADHDTLRDITGRLGLADVRAFGLTWEDCEEFLSRLGYRAKIDVFQST